MDFKMKFRLLTLAAGLACCLSCIQTDPSLGGVFVPVTETYTFHTAEIPLEGITLQMADKLSGFSDDRITVGAIPDEAREKYALPSGGGLYISAVSEGSDAAAKGLQAGDIILKVNGVEVSTTAEISAMKEELSVGDTMTFTIWRDGEILDVDVMLVDTNDVYG